MGTRNLRHTDAKALYERRGHLGPHCQRATLASRHGPLLTPGVPVHASLPADFTLKRYEIIRTLGQGGMGTVLLAHDTKLNRLVAIKVLLARGDHWAQRFLAEAQATARCQHENIVAIHDVDESGGYPYMVLEYVEGRTLRSFLEQRPSGPDGAPARRPVDLALEIAIPVVRALGCAHALGIVHRDLKPENVLLADAGPVKVFDFGIAKQPGAEEVSRMAGTLPYMSPEHLRAEEVDARSDLWAAGLILHELATETHPLAPFSAGWRQRAADADVPIPSVAQRHPELGPLGGVIDRCLQKRRDRRIGSAAELLAELERLKRDPGGSPASAALLTPSAG